MGNPVTVKPPPFNTLKCDVKTPQEWVKSQISPITPGEPRWSLSLEDICTIQKDAFDAGRVAGLNEAGELCISQEQGKTEFMKRLSDLIHQPKDTTCSKSTP